MAIELTAYPTQSADGDARAFNGDAVRVARLRHAADGQSRNSLQHFGDAAIGKRADVVCGDRIDELGGVLLAGLRSLELPANTGDDDFIDFGRRGIRGRLRAFSRCLRECRSGQDDAQTQGGRGGDSPSPTQRGPHASSYRRMHFH